MRLVVRFERKTDRVTWGESWCGPPARSNMRNDVWDTPDTHFHTLGFRPCGVLR